MIQWSNCYIWSSTLCKCYHKYKNDSLLCCIFDYHLKLKVMAFRSMALSYLYLQMQTIWIFKTQDTVLHWDAYLGWIAKMPWVMGKILDSLMRNNQRTTFSLGVFVRLDIMQLVSQATPSLIGIFTLNITVSFITALG